MTEIQINGLKELEAAIMIEEVKASPEKPARNKRNIIKESAAKGKPAKVAAKPAVLPAKVIEAEKEEMKPVVDKTGRQRLTRFGKYPAARVGDTTPHKLLQRVYEEMPKAHSLPLYYQGGEDASYSEAEGYQGIFVEFGGKEILVDVPTDTYHLVQHAEAFAPHIEALADHHGTERIRAAMTYNAREAFIYASFPDKLSITPSDGKKIELGVVMHNSLDRSSAVTFDGYGLRLACMNMFGFSELLGHESIRHTASAKDRLITLLSAFEFAADDLTATINGARQVPVKEEQVKEWFRQVFGDKMQMAFLASFRDQEATAYGLYNAVTEVLTHNPAYAGDRQFNEIMQAEPILFTPEEEMIQIFEESAEINREKDARQLIAVEARRSKKARKVA